MAPFRIYTTAVSLANLYDILPSPATGYYSELQVSGPARELGYPEQGAHMGLCQAVIDNLDESSHDENQSYRPRAHCLTQLEITHDGPPQARQATMACRYPERGPTLSELEDNYQILVVG